MLEDVFDQLYCNIVKFLQFLKTVSYFNVIMPDLILIMIICCLRNIHNHHHICGKGDAFIQRSLMNIQNRIYLKYIFVFLSLLKNKLRLLMSPNFAWLSK